MHGSVWQGFRRSLRRRAHRFLAKKPARNPLKISVPAEINATPTARSLSPALTLPRHLCPRCNSRAGLGTPAHPKRPTDYQKHRTSLFAFDRRERQRTSDARFRSDAPGNGCALTRRRPLNGSDPGVASGPSSELAAATFNELHQRYAGTRRASAAPTGKKGCAEQPRSGPRIADAPQGGGDLVGGERRMHVQQIWLP